METVSFKKKVSKKPATKRIRPSKEEEDSQSDSDDEVVRKQAKTSGAGLAISSQQLQPKTLVEVAALEYTGDRSTTQQNDSGVFREAPDIDGRDVKRELTQASSDFSGSSTGLAKKKSKGPMKAPANVRAISVIDYQPDVCKDYKQTGYCGFGDTCKFLHDRGDFKQGWQLDREWEEAAKSKRTDAKHKSLLDAETEEIPFRCIICKGDYKSPVITKCGHYFCESCALTRYKKTASCAQCGHGTGGLFSGAKKLQELLELKRATPIVS